MIDVEQIRQDPQVIDWIGLSPEIALYPSGGRDTYPMTFFHPRSYPPDQRGVVPAPQILIYNDRGAGMTEMITHRDSNERNHKDRATSIIMEAHGIDFGQWVTTITQEWSRQLSPGITLLGYRWVSQYRHFEDRNYVVVNRQGDNRTLQQDIRPNGWLPDVFVGVCDGCRRNRTDRCVNALTLDGLSPDAASRVPLPKWWITDHFVNAHDDELIEVGSFVRSADSRFPVAFEAVRKLSYWWGNYGAGEPSTRGTWLFKTVPVAELSG